MQKTIVIFIASLSCCLITGCGTINGIVHRAADHPRTKDLRFAVTRTDAGMIHYFAFDKPRGIEDMFAIGKGCTSLAVFPIADLPLSIATDIVCFPYDTYVFFTRKNNDAFWAKALETGEGTPKEGARRMTVFTAADLQSYMQYGRNADDTRHIKVDNPQPNTYVCKAGRVEV